MAAVHRNDHTRRHGEVDRHGKYRSAYVLGQGNPSQRRLFDRAIPHLRRPPTREFGVDEARRH